MEEKVRLLTTLVPNLDSRLQSADSRELKGIWAEKQLEMALKKKKMMLKTDVSTGNCCTREDRKDFNSAQWEKE